MSGTSTRYMVDLFAGCGGLSLGLEQEGFEPLLFSEINKDAADTYLANRSHLELEDFRDIQTLTDSRIRSLRSKWKLKGIDRIDVVCGGPPCQGYSGIGHRRTFAVERQQVPSNHLYLEMIRVIRQFQPRMFLFENVRGLLFGRWTRGGEKGEIFRDVLAAFSRIPGYEVRWDLVQAKDYGVPQNRPRVLIVGIHKSLGWEPLFDSPHAVESGLLPSGTGQGPDLVDVLGDLVDPDYLKKRATTAYPSPARSSFQKEMRARVGHASATLNGQALTEHEYSSHSPAIREKFEYMLANGGQIPPHMQTKKFAQRVLPARWGREGPNITATSLPDDFVHYCQPRSLTVREWARIQCFPDWYQFRGPRTTGGHRRAGRPDMGVWDRDVPRYTQIGNAVPVRLARAIGAHFQELLANLSAARSASGRRTAVR